MIGYRPVAFNLECEVDSCQFEDSNITLVENLIFGIFPFPVKIAGIYTYITLATQYLRLWFPVLVIKYA